MEEIPRYVEAPNELIRSLDRESVFLGGGITGCPDWQNDLRPLLEPYFTVVSPRRINFPINEPDEAQAQIEWEFRHLRLCDRLVFWFCAATLNPIVLYELGAWSMTDKPIVVGIEPGYQREQDVRIQTALVRPDVPIVTSLLDLARTLIDG